MTKLQISTSPRSTWLCAPDEETAAQVREITGGRIAHRNGKPLPVVIDVDVGAVALEACEALTAEGYTFFWHEYQHPLNQGWLSQLPGVSAPQQPRR